MTGIHGGERVPKDDIRIEANGCIDELNTVIGIVRSLLPIDDVWQGLLSEDSHSKVSLERAEPLTTLPTVVIIFCIPTLP